MGTDSATDLIFKIGADPSDAQNNIARFRSLLNKDLDGMKAEFGDWAKSVFGSMSTPAGAAAAGVATLAAGMVAAAGVAVECAKRYEQYVEQVDEASDKTGIAAETMSKLQYAAHLTGTENATLTASLLRLESAVDKANTGSEKELAIFDRLGVSRAALKAGEKDVIPVLEAVMDGFSGMASGTQKAAVARELFSRGGASLIEFLSMGSAGLRRMGEEAERLGMIVTEKDVVALKEHEVATRLMKDQLQAAAVTIGREVVPALTVLTAMVAAMPAAAQKTGEEYMTLGGTIKSALTMGFAPLFAFFGNVGDETANQLVRIQRLVQTMMASGDKMLKAPKAEAPKLEAWTGLSTILDQVRSKLAAAAGDEAKVADEVQGIGEAIAKAVEELAQKQAKGEISDTVAGREMRALQEAQKLLPELYARLMQAIADKRQAALEQTEEELRGQIEGQQARGFEQERAAWDREIEAFRAKEAKKGPIAATTEALLAELRAAGQARIGREQLEAFSGEMAQLQGYLAQTIAVNMTQRERLGFQYDLDLQKFSEVEQEKKLLAAKGTAAREAIEDLFTRNRTVLTQRYEGDLQALANSQGWRAVFGAPFTAMIRGNEALLREWAQSANQSHMLVRASLEGLRETGQRTFGQFAQGMGANISNALIYKKSIGQAMRETAVATLESLAAESIAYALYSTALGFYLAAKHDYVGSGKAFTAAALWGSVGAAAAVAGRAIAPAQGGQDRAGAGAGDVGGGAGSEAGGGSNAQIGPRVTVNVWGHIFGVSGIHEVASALNDAVLNRDEQLTATDTKTGRQVLR